VWTVLTQALKAWKSAKAIALLAVIAFAVGIGATTAIFTVVNQVMLKPLPYPEGDRLAALFGAKLNEPGRLASNTVPDLLEYQQRTTSFDVFGWFLLNNFNLTAPGEPQYVDGAAVTPSLAQHLGVNPVSGQWFTDDSGAVISDALWRRLGANPGIVGQPITLSGRRLTITGVMPPDFRLPVSGPGVGSIQSDIWTYLDPLGRAPGSNEGAFFAYARRKPGVTLAQAQADVRRAAVEIAKLDPATHPFYTGQLNDLREMTYSDLRSTLLLLFGAAGLLLLISCANVATLLLARSVARARETAIRVALGASHGQLALRYFVEGAVLAVAGGIAGVVLSVALVRLMVWIGSAYLPAREEIAVDWKVIVFGLGIAFLASALSSLAPLWQAVRTAPNDVLTEGVRASVGAGIRRLSQTLVVAEIALAFTLLAVSAVLVAHLRQLTQISPGFEPDQLLTFELTLADASASSPTRALFETRLIEAIEAVPSVGGAALASQLPLGGCCFGGTIHPEGRSPSEDRAERVSFVLISPGYFRTMGIPLRRGRVLNEGDAREGLLSVVINETAANRYWPASDPVSAYGRLNQPDGDRFQVVGVVGDVRNDGLNKPPEAEIYLLSATHAMNPLYFVVRSPLPMERLVPDVRRAVQGIDPSLPIHDPTLMNQFVQEALQLERVGSLTMISFGAAALLMATLGIYGVVSYSVRQRTVEIGTRMALGAVGRDVLALVVGGGMKMAVYGVALGGVAVVGAAWLLVRYFEIRDLGWLPFASSTGVVALVAGAASFSPAWRATLLSPMVAIRNEPGSIWRSIVSDMARSASDSEDATGIADGVLLTEFVAAARSADSFAEALQLALHTLSRKLGAQWAVLLEKRSAQDYHGVTATGALGLADWSLPAQGFLLNRFQAYPFPLPFSSSEFEVLVRWAGEHKPARLAEIETLRDASVRMAVPLRTKKEFLGVLLLGPPTERDQYGAADVQVLVNCADQFALMMENARLTDRVVEQDQLRRDLALAAEVQKRLLPEQPPLMNLAQLAAVSVPARGIGGDYYDFIDAGDHQIGIALADVSGKGVAAALIMSALHASLRIISTEGSLSLPELVAKVNRFLFRSTPSNKYATFFYAQVDGKSLTLRYVNAGHNPPYLVRADEIQELATGGAVVGMFPEMSYEEATINLQPHDVLVAFTDGVTEAQSPGDEEFSEDRLKDLLRQIVHLPAQEISARIAAALRDWIKDADQYDDLTFIVLKVN